MALLGFNTAFGSSNGLPVAYGVFVVVAAVPLLAWTLMCTVVAAQADFCFRDVLRAYYVFS